MLPSRPSPLTCLCPAPAALPADAWSSFTAEFSYQGASGRSPCTARSAPGLPPSIRAAPGLGLSARDAWMPGPKGRQPPGSISERARPGGGRALTPVSPRPLLLLRTDSGRAPCSPTVPAAVPPEPLGGARVQITEAQNHELPQGPRRTAGCGLELPFVPATGWL